MSPFWLVLSCRPRLISVGERKRDDKTEQRSDLKSQKEIRPLAGVDEARIPELSYSFATCQDPVNNKNRSTRRDLVIGDGVAGGHWTVVLILYPTSDCKSLFLRREANGLEKDNDGTRQCRLMTVVINYHSQQDNTLEKPKQG